MPTDAKCGLLVGVVVVLAVAVLFFQKDPAESAASARSAQPLPAAPSARGKAEKSAPLAHVPPAPPVATVVPPPITRPEGDPPSVPVSRPRPE